MSKLQNSDYQYIHTHLNEEVFNELVLPHLWQGSRGPKPKISLYKIFNYILKVLYTGCQWKELPIDKGPDGKAEIHYTRVYRKFVHWVTFGSLQKIFVQTLVVLKEQEKLDLQMLHGDGSNTVAKKGGDGVGYSGHKHQKGEKLLAIADNRGNIIAPALVAPVNESDMKLLPGGLLRLKETLRALSIRLPKSTLLNLDAGFDSRKNRKCVWNAGLRPNIKENPRNRKKARRGRKRFFDKEAYKQRFVIERTFAWADKFRRILIRHERYQARFFGFQLLAFTLINLRNIIN